MPTTKRYLQSTKNLNDILGKIVTGAAPTRFTFDHLKGLGFTSSNDRSVIGVLKDLSFLTEDGIPTDRYHAYRDTSRSKSVMGEALREAYPDVFLVSEKPGATDRTAIRGKFKTLHGVGDAVAEKMAATFFALLDRADLVASATDSSAAKPVETPQAIPPPHTEPAAPVSPSRALVPIRSGGEPSLHYDIQIHLPATRDIEVFNAIFKSLRENLL